MSRAGTFGLYNRTADNKKIESYVVTNNQSPEKEMSWEEMRRKEKEDTLKKLSQAMADTLKEDRDGEYSQFIVAGHDRYMNENGQLTQALLADLKDFKYNELMNLEEKIKNSRLPTEDLFGIKRSLCKVCESGCSGYDANVLMAPSHGEFPTFCKNCKCPSHFHHVCFDVSTDVKFPAELKETIQNHNIQSKDINFNCVVMAFQIRSETMQTSNMNELMAIMREEGLEVISLEKKDLEIEEAIYLKSKMITQTENLMFESFGVLQQHKALGRVNEIRRDTRHGSAFVGKEGRTDPFVINLQSDVKEAKLIQNTHKLASQYPKEHMEHIPGLTLNHKPGQQHTSVTQQNIAILDTINQRVGLNQPESQSIPRTSNLHQDPKRDQQQLIDEQISLLRRDTMTPIPKNKTFKVKVYHKAKTQIKRSIIQDRLMGLSLEEEEAMLANQVNKDPLLQELLSKEVVLLAIGSATYQGLENKIKSQVMQKIKVFLPPEEMPLLYLSETRTSSLEDSIIFFPSLFKLTKSIVVSEPLQAYFQGKDLASANIVTNNRNPDLQAKLQSLNDTAASFHELIGGDQSDEDEDFLNFYKNRVNMKIKSSSKLKVLLKKRDQLKKQQKEQDIFGNDIEWVERAQNRDRTQKKKQKLLSQSNKMLYNYGVMHDFFNYSAMTIQKSMHNIDIMNPPSNALKDNALYELVRDAASGPGKSNIFAIAKVGLPNLILPSSLEVKLTNYNAFQSYLNLCDSFFPDLSSSEISILVLRPLVIKNGLNDFMLRILKINEFTILKRKQRMLSKAELAYLAEQETISDDKCESYYNMMMEGEVEIIAVTKLGAVADLCSIVNGCAPLGRRRVAQLDEDTSIVRTNVDAVNSMFEITPFTSMSEFIDIEDFIMSHSKLQKYRKQFNTGGRADRLNDQLYLQKVEELRKELNVFSRYFNLVAHVPTTHDQAQKEVCVLMPECAIVEEIIIILNPLYCNFMESASKLIKRMGFKVLNQTSITLDEETATELFKEKMSPNVNLSGLSQNSSSMSIGEKLTRYLSGTQVYAWHLAKISADREVRQLFTDAQVELDDLLRMRVKSGPFKPQHFPFLFMFMETPFMFETMFKKIWGEKFTQVTGQHLIDQLTFSERTTVLNLALQTTLGDSIKILSFDRFGNMIDPASVSNDKVLAVQVKIPQMYQLYGNPKGSNAVHSVVESDGHGLFEIRYTRLPHTGDLYNISVEPSKLNIEKLKLRYFTKFEALNLYYNEVNKHYYNICPAFYRFKISPLIPSPFAGSEQLNRVFEVEEYMGVPFMQDIAQMHQDHIRMLKNHKQSSVFSLGKTLSDIVNESEQRSMPPYIWGTKIARMVQQLQEVKGPSCLKGAGRLVFADGQVLRGENPDSQKFFEVDRQKYYRYLEDFKKGWSYYLSALECDLIESKIRRIIDSQTFKQSRKPENLSLIPDKMTDVNLRISEKIQLLVEESMQQESFEKFYQHLKQPNVDPENEERAVNMVQSIMHTLHIENTKPNPMQRRFKDNNEGRGFKLEDLEKIYDDQQKRNKDFSIYKDCAIVGVDVARRPKHQLIASIYYLINFYLRKVDRKTQLFKSVERGTFEDQDPLSRQQAENYYDEILDILCGSIKDNFGRDEFNYALDMVSLFQNPAEQTQFDKIVKDRQEIEKRYKQTLSSRIEEQMRAMRSQMSFEDLMKSIQTGDPRAEEQKQQELLRRFVEKNGSNDHHGDGFMNLLRETQSYLGPYSIKMASDYLHSLEVKEKSQQEKISFVKMEYFLYAVTQAHECVLDLKQMEARINELQDDLDSASLQVTAMAGFNPSGSMPMHMKNKNDLGQYQKKIEVLEECTKKMETLRYQISMKETLLIQIFRELMSWDYTVPDFYFDEVAMLDRKKQDQLQDTYTLPTRTFWKPVYFDNYREPNLMNENFARRFRDYRKKEDLKEEALPKSNDPNAPKPPRKGVLISYLRPYDAKTQNDYIKFDKYFSSGEFFEQQDLHRLKTKIDFKLTRDFTNTYSNKFKDMSASS